MEKAKGGEFYPFPTIPIILIGVTFIFVSEDVWSWDLLVERFLQSRYLLWKRGQDRKGPSDDRQSGLTWANEDHV